MSRIGDNMSAMEVKVAGNLAYVADLNAGLVIFDITDKSSPVEVSRYRLSGADGIDVVGNRAYLASTFGEIAVLDITTPSQPVLIGSSTQPANSKDVRVVGDLVYINDGYGGVLVLKEFVFHYTYLPGIIH